MIAQFFIKILATAVALVSIVAFVGRAAEAAPLYVESHSFEEPYKDDTGSYPVYYNELPSGWTKVSGAGIFGVWNPADRFAYEGSDDLGLNNGTLPYMDGVQVGFITGDAAATVIEHTLSDVVEDNTTYTLTVAVGSRSEAGSYWNGDHEFELSLLAGSTVAASYAGNSTALPNGTFTDLSATFTTDASGDPRSGQPLTIRYANLTGGGNGDFDNVRVDATVVPEPATLALFGLGSLLVLLRRKR